MFQFPSNGKAYPKDDVKINPHYSWYRFQFPSNGKAYPKTLIFFSIVLFFPGFDSLQTGKRIQRQRHIKRTSHQNQSFNSLQTGKRIQSLTSKSQRSNCKSCFNSLQTGRHIQTRPYLHLSMVVKFGFNSLQSGRHVQTNATDKNRYLAKLAVSIPFNREGTFRR